jgi:hypothetical protein
MQKDRACGPAPPYTHLLRRSGRSPALPYPPSKRSKFITDTEELMAIFSTVVVSRIGERREVAKTKKVPSLRPCLDRKLDT